jgi:YD repeat-containing protein
VERALELLGTDAPAEINADGVVTQLAYDSADDLTSSATPDGNGSEVEGDIYTLDGLRTNNRAGGGPGSAAVGDPSVAVYNGGNMYMVDASGNRVLEVAGSTGTQWGQSMTAGDTYVVAGKGITESWAVLNHPQGLAFDPAGDLYIADTAAAAAPRPPPGTESASSPATTTPAGT